MSRPRLIAVGDLTPVSGLETTIAALRGLPGVELVVIGTAADDRLGAGELARLRAGAVQLGLAERVTFADAERDRTDPAYRPALLRSSDAVVCVPWHGPASAAPVPALDWPGVRVRSQGLFERPVSRLSLSIQ